MSKAYLVHIEPAIDGSLDPNLWRTIKASDPDEAIAKALRSSAKDVEFKINTAYVAIGTARHSNGAPIAVQSYALTWNIKKEAIN